MKALENRTEDSKREMDILDALQDIRARNARNERVGNSSVDLLAKMEMEEIETAEDLERKKLEEEDEKLVRQVFSKIPDSGGGDAVITVKRKADDIEPTVESLLPDSAKALISSKAQMMKKPKLEAKNKLGIKMVKKKPAAKAV